jgi:hypothetical protein
MCVSIKAREVLLSQFAADKWIIPKISCRFVIAAHKKDMNKAAKRLYSWFFVNAKIIKS